jgi:hypothetical protein
MMRPAPPRFIGAPSYTLFFHRFPVVPEAIFWHNKRMPTCAEKNAESPDAVLSSAHPDPAPATSPAPSANDPNASPRPRDDRAASEEIPSGDDRAASEEIPSGEIGGPSGPEPTRFGDWEKKGRCIDF